MLHGLDTHNESPPLINQLPGHVFRSVPVESALIGITRAPFQIIIYIFITYKLLFTSIADKKSDASDFIYTFGSEDDGRVLREI